MEIEIEKYRKNIRRAIVDLQNNRLPLMNTLAADTLGTVQRRVQESGIDGNNSAFDAYDKDYAKWRAANGLQTAHKDFTATGRMWQDTNVKVVKHTASQTIVEIAPTANLERNKMKWNADRSGVNLLKLTKQEEAELRKDYQNGIVKILKNNNVI